jgi:hypothetical protein
MAAVSVDCEYNYLNKPERSELTAIITDATYSATSTTLSVTMDVYNASDQSVSQIVRDLPVASGSYTGAMPSEAYQSLSQALTDIQALKNQGGKYIGQGFATKAALNAYTIPASVNVGDFTYVLVDESQSNGTSRYICTLSGSTKVFSFAYLINEAPIGLATSSAAGLVKGVASTGAAGKGYIETDGTISVLGWAALNTATTTNATNITNLTTKVNNLPSGFIASASTPTNTSVLWLNTSDYILRYYNGSAWVRATAVYKEEAGTAGSSGGEVFDVNTDVNANPSTVPLRTGTGAIRANGLRALGLGRVQANPTADPMQAAVFPLLFQRQQQEISGVINTTGTLMLSRVQPSGNELVCLELSIYSYAKHLIKVWITTQYGWSAATDSAAEWFAFSGIAATVLDPYGIMGATLRAARIGHTYYLLFGGYTTAWSHISVYMNFYGKGLYSRPNDDIFSEWTADITPTEPVWDAITTINFRKITNA